MKLVTKIQSKLRIKANLVCNDLKGKLGMNSSFFRQARGARILVYHGICQENATRFNSIFLTEKTFEEHLRFYARYFHIVSLDDYFQKRFSGQRLNICLTFDDGFANNSRYVLPLLEKYNMPATFFVTAIRDAGYDILWNDFLAIAQQFGPAELVLDGEKFCRNKNNRYILKSKGKELKEVLRQTGFEKKLSMMRLLGPSASFKDKPALKDYWLQMTEAEIAQMSHSKWVTIGCHGYYHNDLAMIKTEDAREEMAKAKKYLEKIIAKPVEAIAFPYGSYNRETVDAAKGLGFTRLLTAGFLFQEDHADAQLRERLTINPYISINNQMTAIIHGKYPR
jgi:peptidoglycan/xylan/chitin deacetylase (PgdA/CDA1 family)